MHSDELPAPPLPVPPPQLPETRILQAARQLLLWAFLGGAALGAVSLAAARPGPLLGQLGFFLESWLASAAIILALGIPALGFQYLLERRELRLLQGLEPPPARIGEVSGKKGGDGGGVEESLLVLSEYRTHRERFRESTLFGIGAGLIGLALSFGLPGDPVPLALGGLATAAFLRGGAGWWSAHRLRHAAMENARLPAGNRA